LCTIYALKRIECMMIIKSGRLLRIRASDIKNGHLQVPETVTSIDYRAFSNFTRLSCVTLPAGLTYMAAEAFAGCTHLKDITLPIGLKCIWIGTFKGCTNLTSITLPPVVDFIDHYAFVGCKKLKYIIMDSDNPADLVQLKAILPIYLKDKTISKHEYLRLVRLQIAFGLSETGNIWNRFFSPAASREQHSLTEPQLIKEVMEYL
jgi:hypothetical protein